uniref:Uncharacterized protein n=1 Tax=Anguilla anguilla TaxID=7936 RepID=A0A0E9WMX4_ANGAN
MPPSHSSSLSHSFPLSLCTVCDCCVEADCPPSGEFPHPSAPVCTPLHSPQHFLTGDGNQKLLPYISFIAFYFMVMYF